MHITVFKERLILMEKFSTRLHKENIPFSFKKILIKAYASNLRFNLTDNMAEEILQLYKL